MNFTTNTKPLADALSLGILNSNVSKFYAKSCMAQITAVNHDLTINLEANFIKTEIRLKGQADENDNVCRAMVDSLLFKQLIGTLESPSVKLEFVEGGVIIHSGSSKFTLANMTEADDLELDRPDTPEFGAGEIDIDKSDWRFIKDNQMYAIAMSFIHPVYTRVWVGENGDVLVGDMDNSIFTHSEKSKLGTTCLLSDTIITLFNSLPEGAKLIQGPNRSYIISIKTDAYEMLSQFTPQYEDDDAVGSYSSEIILGMMTKPSNAITVSKAAINKLMSQASLLADGTDSTIDLSYENGKLTLKDKNVKGEIPTNGSMTEMKQTFKTSQLTQVISNYDADTIAIGPYFNGEDLVGILVWTEELTTVLAGVE